MPPLIRYWVLNADHTTSRTDDINEWAKSFERDRVVAKTDIDGVRISTIFMGIDHNHWGKGPPIIFETMVFMGDSSIDMSRSSTWDDAMAQHNSMVRKHMSARQTEVKAKVHKNNDAQ